MLVYVKLAELSARKRQFLGRDKFLILAGASACRSGWANVAERCRKLVVSHNPKHLLSRFDTFADAMRSPEFTALLKRLERFCGYERAEHLLSQVQGPLEPTADEDTGNLGDYVLQLLSGPHWSARVGSAAAQTETGGPE